jgi:hypothetical protein
MSLVEALWLADRSEAHVPCGEEAQKGEGRQLGPDEDSLRSEAALCDLNRKEGKAAQPNAGGHGAQCRERQKKLTVLDLGAGNSAD